MGGEEVQKGTDGSNFEAGFDLKIGQKLLLLLLVAGQFWGGLLAICPLLFRNWPEIF